MNIKFDMKDMEDAINFIESSGCVTNIKITLSPNHWNYMEIRGNGENIAMILCINSISGTDLSKGDYHYKFPITLFDNLPKFCKTGQVKLEFLPNSIKMEIEKGNGLYEFEQYTRIIKK